MFVDVLRRRNPNLIEAAFELHGRGEVPPGTFVIDLEQVERNAQLVTGRAEGLGIGLYYMAKQLGRNPVIARRIAKSIPAAVAVDLDEALLLAGAGLRVGHLGHLVQTPTRFVDQAISLRPEVITVFSLEKAAQLAAAARRAGIEQRLLIRVRKPGDSFYAGQEGGVELSELESVWSRIADMDGVSPAGLTSYPAIALADSGFEPTTNMETLQEGSAIVGGVEQLNAPGHTSAAVLPLLAAASATHGEPGHALSGTTPLAAREDIDETPACCMVTEVSHVDSERVTVFGGAFYNRGHAHTGLLQHEGTRSAFRIEDLPHDAIDYYRHLARDGHFASVGDPVVFAYRFQAFTSRAKVAAVDGVAVGEPQLVGLHDGLGHPVDGGAA